MSIELTIRWNDILGVNTVDSTGQLIPLIMGCVSASQVLKKVILLALGKVNLFLAHFSSFSRTSIFQQNIDYRIESHGLL